MGTNKEPEVEIYTEEQRFWINIKNNCETTIEQFKNSMKLQKAILKMAEEKIESMQ